MFFRSFQILIFLFAFFTGGFIAVPDGYAQDSQKNFRETNLPLPRFVSIRSSEANMRSGPGQQYPIKWVYKARNIPVEIIQEFEHWRKIRDYSGEEGWMHKSLLSGRRTGFTTGTDLVSVYKKDDNTSKTIVKLEPGVMVGLEVCEMPLCRIKIGDYTGWIERNFIWGIYEDEEFD